MSADLVNLKDHGEATFDITDATTGAQVSPVELQAFITDEGENETNKRHRYRCHKCGSVECKAVDDIHMGSSWTGLYGSMYLECNACDAYLTLFDP